MFAGFWKAWSQTLGGRLPILALCIGWEGMGASGQQPPFQPPSSWARVMEKEAGPPPACLPWTAHSPHSRIPHVRYRLPEFQPGAGICTLSCPICTVGITTVLEGSRSTY